MTVTIDAYYARQADREARLPQVYGAPVEVASLRAFRRYHKDARVDTYDLMGHLRWMTQKQARIYGLLMRQAVSGERITMTKIAAETLVCPSTVSRAVLKFQAWGIFAIDVVRGRNGGVKVRLRTIGDELASYAEAAWQRLRSMANRARIKVASLINLRREGYEEPDYETAQELTTQLLVSMDATFMEAWANAESRGASVLAEAALSEREIALLGPVREIPRHVDSGAFAEAVIAERRRLAIIDPEGEAEAVRPLW